MLNISLTSVICSENLNLQNINVRSGQAQFAILSEFKFPFHWPDSPILLEYSKEFIVSKAIHIFNLHPNEKLIIMNIINTAIKYSFW